METAGREYTIYGLHLEGDEEIRYVGSTTDPQGRLRGHLRGDEQKDAWTAANHDRVRMRVLQRVTADPRLAERRWAKRLAREGHRIFNQRLPRRLTKTERTEAMLAWFEQHPEQ
jgi:hypothetical protein